MSLDSIGRLVYAVRSVVREVAVFDYRGAVPDTGASTVFRLGEAPVGSPGRAAVPPGAGRRGEPAAGGAPTRAVTTVRRAAA